MNAQDPNYIPILASITTGVIAFFGVVLTNRANFKRIKLENEIEARRKRLELHRERGEELFVSVDRWLNALGAVYLRVLRIMYGKLTYNEHNELTIGMGKPDYDFARVEMIIDVYFPEVRSHYDRVIEARTEVNAIETEFKRKYESGNTDGRLFIATFIEAQKIFEAAGYQLKSQIKQCLSAV